MSRKFVIILHIGTEKTGTTTLQQTFFNNKSFLLGEGIYYRHSKSAVHSRDLASACIGDGYRDRFLTRAGVMTSAEHREYRDQVGEALDIEFQQMPEHVHTIIISSEHFHSRLRNAEMVERLKKLMMPYASDFRVVCYLRRQVDMVMSAYSTALKAGAPRSFETHYKRILHPRIHYCNYYNFLCKWSAIFGKNSLYVRIFDKNKLRNSSTVDDFLDIVDISPRVLSNGVADINESVSPIGQRLLFEMNKTFADVKGEQLLKRIRKIRRKLASAFPGKGKQLHSKQAEALQTQFDASNEAVRAEWFPEEKQLFSKMFASINGDQLDSDQEMAVEQLFGLINSNGRYAGRLEEYDPYVDALIAAAKTMETSNPETTLQLLELACAIRPNDPVIQIWRRSLEQKI